MVDIIMQALALVLGGGTLGYILFFNSKKRKERAEAAKLENDNERDIAGEWKEIAERKERRVDLLSNKIDEIYKELNEERKARQKLELEKMALEFKACNRRGCPDREPQTGY